MDSRGLSVLAILAVTGCGTGDKPKAPARGTTSAVSSSCGTPAISQQTIPTQTTAGATPATAPATVPAATNPAGPAPTSSATGIPQATYLQAAPAAQAPVGGATTTPQASPTSPVATQTPAPTQTAGTYPGATPGNGTFSSPGCIPTTGWAQSPPSADATAQAPSTPALGSGTTSRLGADIGTSAMQTAVTDCMREGKYFDRSMAATFTADTPLSGACSSSVLLSKDIGACSSAADIVKYLTDNGAASAVASFNQALKDAGTDFVVDQCISCIAGSAEEVCKSRQADGTLLAPKNNQIGVMLANRAQSGPAAKKVAIPVLKAGN